LTEPKREELRVRHQKAILVTLVDPAQPRDKEHVLDELRGLAKTAGIQVVGTLVQTRAKPDPATYLGRGKLGELKQLIEVNDAELVVFDNNLSPAQGRNLEKETNTIIVDRSEVILDIFASTARTYEAKLQVELAQLLYSRPRLKRLWTHLERIEGGVGAGRGPGEKQIETDRRLIDRRVAELKRKLRDVEERRRQTVARRSDELTVSLVGYTNAGKSTLMNALSGSDVLVADKLFATLDTRTRRWNVPDCGDVLLSDTVGFIRDLPHHLVASFHSTLEEARQARLLLHVVDASDPAAEQHVEIVHKVLGEIGVDDSNTVLVLNKIDACRDRSRVDILRNRFHNSVTTSARTGFGLDRLTQAVAERLGGGYVDAEIETSIGNGRLLAYLAEHGQIRDRAYHDDSRVTLSCRIPRYFLSRVNGSDTRITVNGALPAASKGSAQQG
jgi:GTP-binding protein HflX